jgi:hypothetical protein
MLKFREWLIEAEEKDDDDVSHSGAYKDVLGVDRSSFEGLPISYSGQLGDKMYNLLPVIIDKFIPDAENPTHVQLKIDSSTNPHLTQQVIWAKDDDKDEEAPPDEGTFQIPIEEFDELLGQPWGPAVQQGAMGGMGGMGGGLGGML